MIELIKKSPLLIFAVLFTAVEIQLWLTNFVLGMQNSSFFVLGLLGLMLLRVVAISVFLILLVVSLVQGKAPKVIFSAVLIVFVIGIPLKSISYTAGVFYLCSSLTANK